MKKDSKKIQLLTGRKLLFSALAFSLASVGSNAQTLKINIQDAQFTKTAIEGLISEYQKQEPAFAAVVTSSAQGGTDATVQLSVEATDYSATVGRFVVLPVANSQNELLQNKKVQRGLNDKLKRQLFVERSLVEELDAEEAGEKKLPGTVYTLCGNKAVATQVLAKKWQVSPKDLKGKKILGREENLLTAVKSHADAVSYNLAPLLYDAKSHQPVSGLTILPVDLDGNGKITDEERAAFSTLDQLTAFIGQLPKTSAATGYIDIRTENAQLKAFVGWIQGEGQQHLAQYGLLKAAENLTARR